MNAREGNADGQRFVSVWYFILKGQQKTVVNLRCRSLLVSISVSSQVFTRYGKCYMFNAEEEGKTLRTTMKGGTGNGLEIMLDIQQDEYLPVWGDTGRTGTTLTMSCSNPFILPVRLITMHKARCRPCEMKQA